jgi:hypothetical protein
LTAVARHLVPGILLKNLQLRGPGVLIIKNATRADANRYTCYFSYKVNNVVQNSIVKALRVNFSGAFVEKSNSIVITCLLFLFYILPKKLF